MSRLAGIVVVVVGTALMFMLCVVVIAVVMMPLTYGADWWLGAEYELLSHPQRNALALGLVVMIVFIIFMFGTVTPSRPRSQSDG